MPKVYRAVLAAAAIFTVSVVSTGVTLAAEATPPEPQRLVSTPDGRPRVNGLEARIKELQEKLHITAAQADEWKALAQTMRDNHEAMGRVILEKRKNADKLTAVEDLKLYRKAAETHLENVTRLVAAFEHLYNGMSEEQKRLADEVFHSHGRHGDARLSTKTESAR